MTKDTLVYVAGLLTRLDIKTGAADWREAADRIRAAQDEIAAELRDRHGLIWVPPGGAAPDSTEAASANGHAAGVAPLGPPPA